MSIFYPLQRRSNRSLDPSSAISSSLETATFHHKKRPTSAALFVLFSLSICGIGVLFSSVGAGSARAVLPTENLVQPTPKIPAFTLAQSPQTAPPELQQLIREIDIAANGQDLQAVLQFYSPNFTNSDGLNYQELEKVLNQFWQTYSNVNYKTELQSWKQEGSAILATTVTQITGTQTIKNRDFQLNSTITSEQRIENQKVVQQKIITERSTLSSGENPPTVKFNVPEEVQAGQSYNVDAIVQEPLDEEILIGTALSTPVNIATYFTTEPIQLEFLSSGGIFKVGEAPNTPQDRWVSAILMRRGGITFVTQRLRVVK